jgi:hypothetical protein
VGRDIPYTYPEGATLKVPSIATLNLARSRARPEPCVPVAQNYGVDPRTAAPVYIVAHAPDEGETLTGETVGRCLDWRPLRRGARPIVTAADRRVSSARQHLSRKPRKAIPQRARDVDRELRYGKKLRAQHQARGRPAGRSVDPTKGASLARTEPDRRIWTCTPKDLSVPEVNLDCSRPELRI